jgi:hypothetical protein
MAPAEHYPQSVSQLDEFDIVKADCARHVPDLLGRPADDCHPERHPQC